MIASQRVFPYFKSFIGEWLSLPFSDAEIDADPNLEVLSLRSTP